jgi:hypothetical protein
VPCRRGEGARFSQAAAVLTSETEAHAVHGADGATGFVLSPVPVASQARPLTRRGGCPDGEAHVRHHHRESSEPSCVATIFRRNQFGSEQRGTCWNLVWFTGNPVRLAIKIYEVVDRPTAQAIIHPPDAKQAIIVFILSIQSSSVDKRTYQCFK